jgi:uncharacterized protein (DUF342 family)
VYPRNMNKLERRRQVLAAMTVHLHELEWLLSELMPNEESERRALQQSIAELRQILHACRSEILN